MKTCAGVGLKLIGYTLKPRPEQRHKKSPEGL